MGGAEGTDLASDLLAALGGSALAEVAIFTADELAAARDETDCEDIGFGLVAAVAGAEFTADGGAAEAVSDDKPAVAASLGVGAGETDAEGFNEPAALAAGCGGPGLLLHAPTTIRMTPISATAAIAQRSSAVRPRLPDEAVGTC
ncbi:MAG: hypothetical protein M3Z00_12380 [Actinomycetota bacterium]|nr:hypothetical protein [Actinomycetota bacterium]